MPRQRRTAYQAKDVSPPVSRCASPVHNTPIAYGVPVGDDAGYPRLTTSPSTNIGDDETWRSYVNLDLFPSSGPASPSPPPPAEDTSVGQPLDIALLLRLELPPDSDPSIDEYTYARAAEDFPFQEAPAAEAALGVPSVVNGQDSPSSPGIVEGAHPAPRHSTKTLSRTKKSTTAKAPTRRSERLSAIPDTSSPAPRQAPKRYTCSFPGCSYGHNMKYQRDRHAVVHLKEGLICNLCYERTASGRRHDTMKRHQASARCMRMRARFQQEGGALSSQFAHD
ncbi:hypothetical protein EXIGLDRAFT_768624 [Exidia glandulosa HHB12029]|uniref:Uncharacterized protein n=1 Tax=Exidia glandulosa HHB12029 TaxID=1314781 RepID=A0A165I292_EXIGL|nr:hypothetical protein EXIGLDRAFT_768624 [Exidia glandulosa HHB12029]